MLTLFEELFLLSLDEDTGNILSFAKKPFAYAMTGSILAELVLLDKIRLNEKHRLELGDSNATGDEILDEAIHALHSTEKPHRPSYWISQLDLKPKKLRDQMGARLATQGLLHQEDKRFFWIFAEEEEDHPMPLLKYQLKAALRDKILSNESSEARCLALVKILAASGLLGLIFTRDELPLSGRVIKEKVIRSALENPALQTIEEIAQAVATTFEDAED